MHVRPICSIDRAHNGWVVTVPSAALGGTPRSYLCQTWDEVLDALLDAAFLNKDEPRMP